MAPRPVAAAAACVVAESLAIASWCFRAMILASTIANDYRIGQEAMEMIYMSPDSYHDSFDELLNIRHLDISQHATASLSLLEHNGKVLLASMAPGTPSAKMLWWRTRIRGAWLIKIGSHFIHLINDARLAIVTIHASSTTHIPLLFAHPKTCPIISRHGLPIILSAPFTQQVHDQLNNRWKFSTVADHLRCNPSYQLVDDGGVHNAVTFVMKLTRSKLMKQPDWNEWLASEYMQLDQYEAQGMFGDPTKVDSEAAVFHTVWTYAIKALDGWYKACCTCDGSPRSGQARVLEETYANYVNQTGARIFYSIAAVESVLIFGADVSNAFAEAPPPNRASI
jgi:hypothetical protein